MSVERLKRLNDSVHVYLHSEVNEADKFRSADSLFSHNNATASQERANPPQYPETLGTNQLTRFSSIHAGGLHILVKTQIFETVISSYVQAMKFAVNFRTLLYTRHV